jgi:hypothetical protein
MSIVNVLDIDLDVFLDPRPWRKVDEGRLSPSEYQAWSPIQVEEYLVERCKLDPNVPIPGQVVVYHHELFDIWNRLIAGGTLQKPFSLTHIDSHADLGLGDPSYVYIMCDLLHADMSLRNNPKREGAYGLSEGNYVSFALACRWISEFKYVQHPSTRRGNHGGLPDIADSFFEDNDPKRANLQLKRYPQGIEVGINRITEYEPVALEPPVPISYYDRDTFVSTDNFSFLFTAISPNYTPETTDRIIPVIKKFISPI